MRVLSTQEPRCRTAGTPIASHTSRRPGPALIIISGVRKPCLPEAWAAQPVTTTSTSLAMSCLTRLMMPSSCGTRALLAADDAGQAADAAGGDGVV